MSSYILWLLNEIILYVLTALFSIKLVLYIIELLYPDTISFHNSCNVKGNVLKVAAASSPNNWLGSAPGNYRPHPAHIPRDQHTAQVTYGKVTYGVALDQVTYGMTDQVTYGMASLLLGPGYTSTKVIKE